MERCAARSCATTHSITKPGLRRRRTTRLRPSSRPRRRCTHHEQIVSDGYIHDERFSDCLIINGIDVSYAQKSRINWRSVKKSGVDFVFIRAGYRSLDEGNLREDEEFARNIKGAKEAGIAVGLYFYSQAKNEEEAMQEAAYLLELAAPYEIDLPLVFDIEIFEGGRLDQAIDSGETGPGELTAAANAFCDAVEAGGYESAVYSNYLFLERYLDPENLGKRTNVWVAHYKESTEYPYDYSFWQCGTMEVPGISEEVDKNFWYVDPEATYETRGARNGKARSVSKLKIKINEKKVTYLGIAVKPHLTVQDGFRELTEGVDYRLTYLRNAAEGTGYVIITGIGDYKDAVIRSFEIKDLV